MEKINWTTYNQIFPDRYLEPSYFDEYIEEIVKEKRSFSCLDIGCGIDGTKVLDRRNCMVTSLEPNCKSPWGINIDWNSYEKFNLIIARGSLNYLTPHEIGKIRELMGFHNSTFVANTFLNPPDSRRVRPFLNSHNDVRGFEMSLSYNKDDVKMIKHYLVILSQDYFITDSILNDYDIQNDIRNLNFSSDIIERVIEHEFYYYDVIDYISMFGGEVTFKSYNDNKSIIIRIDN